MQIRPAFAVAPGGLADLGKYMHFIRGDTGGGVRGVDRRQATYFKDSQLDGLPVRLDPQWELAIFMTDQRHML